jgi:VanZ family protein
MMTSIFLRTVAWCVLAYIVFVTISPVDLRPDTIISVNIDRAGAYAVLGLLFASAYPRHWKTVAILLAIGAVGFEFLQEFSPTRHARVDDAIVKAVGALVGVAIGHLVNRTRLRRLSNA